MDTEKFRIDTKTIFHKRPIGVTGLMRVKNDGQFIALSIESCINALDELIIVYQKSDDDTEKQINIKKRQYPKKIKVYFYEPEIKSHNLTIEEFEYVSNLPNDCVNLLSNYYNYTLSKASFRYAMKIDADQIYNSEKLKEICDAYRATTKCNISLSDKFVYYSTKLIARTFQILYSRFNIDFLPNINRKWYNTYYSYCLKIIQNEKVTSSFMGINLYLKDNTACLPLGRYDKNTFPPFNGIDDHLLFEITDKTYYIPAPCKSEHYNYKNCVIEKFAYDEYIYRPLGLGLKLINLGFLWFHVAPIKQRYFEETKDRYNDILLSFNDTQNRNLRLSLNLPLFVRQRFWFKFYWQHWNNQSDKIKKEWDMMLGKIKGYVHKN